MEGYIERGIMKENAGLMKAGKQPRGSEFVKTAEAQVRLRQMVMPQTAVHSVAQPTRHRLLRAAPIDSSHVYPAP
jgi:hypothetical protein